MGFEHFLQVAKDTGVIKICILRCPTLERVCLCLGTAIEVTEFCHSPRKLGRALSKPLVLNNFLHGETEVSPTPFQL